AARRGELDQRGELRGREHALEAAARRDRCPWHTSKVSSPGGWPAAFYKRRHQTVAPSGLSLWAASRAARPAPAPPAHARSAAACAASPRRERRPGRTPPP